MNFSSSPESDPGVIERIRGAYRELPEEEKAKIVKFAALRRFTHDLFENWRLQSGLETSEILRNMADERRSEPVRERLDAALLKDGNEQLLIETITNYLKEGNQELLASVSEWVARAKSAGSEGASLEVPEAVKEHSQGGLLEAIARGGLLVQEVSPAPTPAQNQPEVAIAVPSIALAGVHPVDGLPEQGGVPADKTAALEQLDELGALMDSVQTDIERIRNVTGAIDLGALERKLSRANLLAWGLHQFAGSAGHWDSGDGLREVINSIPDVHAIWATALADLLEEVPVNHPLRRKREAAETIRDAAISELRNFADLGGIEETVPGPFEDVAAWWRWATALSDEEFGDIEDWCSANSLDHLADFIAEQWTLTMNREHSASALSVSPTATMAEDGAALRVDSRPGQTSLESAADEHAVDVPLPPASRHGSLIAAMEAARKQGELGGFAPVAGDEKK